MTVIGPVRHAVSADDATEWGRLTGMCDGRDVYHSAAYHKLAQLSGEGTPVLLAVSSRSHCIALPLLLRPIAGVPGLESVPEFDATSVYGYAGPVSSQPAPDESLLDTFGEWVDEYLFNHAVVAAFSRLHPLLPQTRVIQRLKGQTEHTGHTVVLDLALSEEAQWAQYRNNHRRDIRRSQAAGLTVELDARWASYDVFVELYEQTMKRVQAQPAYFFSSGYFQALRGLLREDYRLFHVFERGEIICSGLFSLCQGIVQYHLGATSASALGLAPSKVLFDAVRRWGSSCGARFLHLGGGVGGKEDDLFRFKEGFSKIRVPFLVWKRVVDEDRYQQLAVQAGHARVDKQAYFPAYRTPRS